jgi:hypothetical protein
MAIDIDCRAEAGGWRCTVRVDDRGGETVHTVIVSRADLERLAPGASAPDDLVGASFEFLLERESNASILRSFGLTDISRYFPEYETAIRRR